MSDVRSMLDHLGDALEDAAAADLYRSEVLQPRPPQRRWRGHRRLLLVAAALVVVVPGAALAADRLLVDEQDVAASLPAGTLALAGTNPTCTVVRENVEYHCVLEKAPAPEVEDWKGTVEPSVDATSHVNGGCRSLNSAGT